MNNGEIHEILADLVAKALRQCGFEVLSDAVVPGGFVDRLARRDATTIAVEVERKPDRVAQNILKANAIGADLLIVCPTAHAVDAARRKLTRSGLVMRKPKRVWVLTPAAARAWVYERFRD